MINFIHLYEGLLAMKKRRRSDFSQKHSNSFPKCYVSVHFLQVRSTMA
ncbi:unnamed protein product, partial [Vitis vinifera]